MNDAAPSTTRHLDAEMAILGCLLDEPALIAQVAAELAPDDFYQQRHAYLFQAMLELADAGSAIDYVTLQAQLGGRLAAAGGIAYITSLVQATTVTTNWASHVALIKQASTLRSIEASCRSILDDIHSGVSFEKVVGTAEQRILVATRSNARPALTTAGEAATQALMAIWDRSQFGATLGVPSGLLSLDKWTTGFNPGELIILAARPSMGKTALALSFALGASLLDYPVAMFSLEMSIEQLANRALVQLSRVDGARVRSCSLSDAEWLALSDAQGRLSSLPLFLNDNAGMTLRELCNTIRQAHVQHGIRLAIVDYLQLVSHTAPSREQEVAQISRSLKRLALELRIPIIALSQLNRSVETRADKRPMMSDLRESGAIEQDADTICFLYRHAVYLRNDPDCEMTEEQARQAELIIAKQRNGPIGTVRAVYRSEWMSFHDVHG